MMVSTPAEQAAEKAVGAIVSCGEAYLQAQRIPLNEWPGMFRAMLEGARLAQVYGPAVPIEEAAAMCTAVAKAQAAFGG